MKKSFLAAASLLFLLNAHSQDQSLINPNQSLLATNPSFAGSNGALRNQFVYRKLWPSISGNSAIMYNGLDTYVKPLHGGIGFTAIRENISNGVYRNSQLSLVYAPYFECKETGLKIIPSLQVSYLQNEADLTSITFGSGKTTQWPATPSSGKKYSFDGSAGLLFNYKNVYAGGTVFHINQPDVGVTGSSKLPSRFNLNASYNLPLNKNTLLNFSSTYSRQQKFSAVLFSANAVLLKHLVLGLGYMNSEVFFVNLGYRNDYVSFTGGYDASYSKLAGNNTGSWQVALGFNLLKKTVQPLTAFEKL